MWWREELYQAGRQMWLWCYGNACWAAWVMSTRLKILIFMQTSLPTSVISSTPCLEWVFFHFLSLPLIFYLSLSVSLFFFFSVWVLYSFKSVLQWVVLFQSQPLALTSEVCVKLGQKTVAFLKSPIGCGWDPVLCSYRGGQKQHIFKQHSCLVLLIHHLCQVVSACLSFMHTARTKVTVHVANLMSTLQ